MKVIPLPPKKVVEPVENEFAPDKLLADALTRKLDMVIILGENEQGMYVSCSSLDAAQIVYMLEVFKLGLLTGDI